ncbi:DNA cytosine methyltransferase [Leptospira interrogans]|uniref:DNA cytosine methyltransferase n=1 Tax=Leptospira interrogans TaxID=173 RepID=UPI00077424E5|nr:DNA cytosine methyltransferase [Leptospira interrogans]
MNELALFAGAGGGILGGKLLGWKTVCAVELNSFRARRLLQRQNEGHLPPFPIWDDVRSFDGFPWRGFVDVVSGGFPCQGVSVAGKGRGLDNEHSGLWKEMGRIICEVRPSFVFVENSPLLTRRGLDRVLGDLASMGFNAIWGVLGANHAGAPQKRERIWILAYSNEIGRRATQEEAIFSGRSAIEFCPWWSMEPTLDRVAYGLANQLDRGRAIGEGQVPAVVRLAWNILNNIRKNETGDLDKRNPT